jgi:hypothetical protein
MRAKTDQPHGVSLNAHGSSAIIRGVPKLSGIMAL